MARYEKIEHEEGQWSEPIAPITLGYKLACCDCGLVHDVEFDAVRVVEVHPDGSFDYKELDPEKYRVVFRMRRNKKSTSLIRRHNFMANKGEIKKVVKGMKKKGMPATKATDTAERATGVNARTGKKMKKKTRG